jgi:hypothetical protein
MKRDLGVCSPPEPAHTPRTFKAPTTAIPKNHPADGGYPGNITRSNISISCDIEIVSHRPCQYNGGGSRVPIVRDCACRISAGSVFALSVSPHMRFSAPPHPSAFPTFSIVHHPGYPGKGQDSWLESSPISAFSSSHVAMCGEGGVVGQEYGGDEAAFASRIGFQKEPHPPFGLFECSYFVCWV